MDEPQLVCYLRSGTCSLRNSVCCSNSFFPLLNLLSNSLNEDQNMTCCSPYAPNTTSSVLLNYPKLSVQFPCKHVMKIWFFILDSLLYMMNCFIFQTKLPIVVYNVRRRYMLTIWLGLKVLTSQVRPGIKKSSLYP